jgi:hypothetical protein
MPRPCAFEQCGGVASASNESFVPTQSQPASGVGRTIVLVDEFEEVLVETATVRVLSTTTGVHYRLVWARPGSFTV